jgi:hypothetical protein
MSIAPWSFSKAKAFEQCPKQFYHEKILQEYPFVETEAIRYGNAFHTAAEEYIRDGTPLPKMFDYAQAMLDSLNTKKGVKLCEEKLGVTENLLPCGFYDKEVWYRGIADLLIINEEDGLAWVGQLELMALLVFAHYPKITHVRAGLLFVVSNDLVKDSYADSDAGMLWTKWTNIYSIMQTAAKRNVWNARPSGLCKRHCPVTVCVHNGSN